MTVPTEDSTELESQDNCLAGVAVTEVIGVARTLTFALSELYFKDTDPEIGACRWANHTCQVGTDGQTHHLRQMVNSLTVLDQHNSPREEPTSDVKFRCDGMDTL